MWFKPKLSRFRALLFSSLLWGFGWSVSSGLLPLQIPSQYTDTRRGCHRRPPWTWLCSHRWERLKYGSSLKRFVSISLSCPPFSPSLGHKFSYRSYAGLDTPVRKLPRPLFWWFRNFWCHLNRYAFIIWIIAYGAISSSTSLVKSRLEGWKREA